jgi:hypothetical protein
VTRVAYLTVKVVIDDEQQLMAYARRMAMSWGVHDPGFPNTLQEALYEALVLNGSTDSRDHAGVGIVDWQCAIEGGD